MKHQELIDKITAIAEGKGWNVNTEENNNVVEFTFSQYTDFGQDFSFTAEMRNGDIDTLIEDVDRFYEAYDPDEEASLWIGPDGHGANGAPYRISDIVKDMEEAEAMVKELLDTLETENSNGTFTT